MIDVYFTEDPHVTLETGRTRAQRSESQRIGDPD